MMHIMMIAPHFPEYSYRLAVALAANNKVCLVIDTATLEAEYRGRMRPTSPNLILSHNKFESIREIIAMFYRIWGFRPDVIHWQEPSGLKKSLFALATTMLMRRTSRLALTIHDPIPHSGRDSVTAARFASFRRYTRKRVHRLFVHGETCRHQYLNDYLGLPHRDERLRVTQHGTILTADQMLLPQSGFSVLMFGRMEAYKGVEVLCDAVEILSRKGRFLDLTIAGAGPEIDRLENRLKIHPSVKIFNRFVASSELIPMIAAANCIVMPYITATQSGVLASAFGNGKPVIASRVGGIPDLAKDEVNALLVSPENPHELAAAILRLWDDASLRDRLSAGARHTASSMLDWQTIVASMEY